MLIPLLFLYSLGDNGLALATQLAVLHGIAFLII